LINGWNNDKSILYEEGFIKYNRVVNAKILRTRQSCQQIFTWW